jgi:hypothetical protein
VVTALLCFGVVYAQVIIAQAFEKNSLTFVTSSGEHKISVEIAKTESERNTGLMFRRFIGDDDGMIFLYNHEEDIAMWMKNTYIPLDMIFVHADGAVSRIETDTEPFSERTIASDGKVLAVIEMKAGSAKRLGLKPGDKVLFSAFH